MLNVVYYLIYIYILRLKYTHIKICLFSKHFFLHHFQSHFKNDKLKNIISYYILLISKHEM